MPNKQHGKQFAAQVVRRRGGPARHATATTANSNKTSRRRETGQRSALAVSHVDAAQQQRDEGQSDHGGRARDHLQRRPRVHRRRIFETQADSICSSFSGCPALASVCPRRYSVRTRPTRFLGRVHSLLGQLVVGGQRGLQLRQRARRTDGRPRRESCGFLRSTRHGWRCFPREVADQHLADGHDLLLSSGCPTG